MIVVMIVQRNTKSTIFIKCLLRRILIMFYKYFNILTTNKSFSFIKLCQNREEVS